MKKIILALLVLSTTAFAQSKTLLNLDKNGVAIQGHDPVAFFNGGQPTRGNAAIFALHDGARYHFATRQLLASRLCRGLAAAILLQTLFFKFTGAPESVFIFTRVGLEPWGRWATGLAELLAAVLLLAPRRPWVGATLALGLMTGALAAHLTVLGVVVRGDGGLLFTLAVTVFACAAATVWLHCDALLDAVHRVTGCGGACARPTKKAPR